MVNSKVTWSKLKHISESLKICTAGGFIKDNSVYINLISFIVMGAFENTFEISIESFSN